jgi:hypothetical protein
VAELPVEAAHHGNDDDQHRDAEHDPITEMRDDRDEPALGTQ